MKRIAIIGAGLAGLTAAKKLQHLAHITLYEKSRGVSGRLSTRRAEPYHFDHGAPYFKARSQAFKDFLTPLKDAGVVKRWHGRCVEFDGTRMVHRALWQQEDMPRYVGAPRMSAMTKHLSQGLNIHLSTRVAQLHHTSGQWQLLGDSGEVLGTFDWIICAAPAEQAAELIPSTLAMHARIAKTSMQGCYALMLGFESQHAPALDFDAALIRNADLSWVSVNHRKPDRPNAFALTVLSSNNWADAHLDADQTWVREHMLQATCNTFGQAISRADHIALHRWRYANVDKQEGAPCLLDTNAKIGVCGDWLIRGNVEAAFSSAHALAIELKKYL